MAKPLDRRPWVILSEREATALLEASAVLAETRGWADLKRAMQVTRRQLNWIHGAENGLAPSAQYALQRDGLR